jgi:hypothetical protein
VTVITIFAVFVAGFGLAIFAVVLIGIVGFLATTGD